MTASWKLASANDLQIWPPTLQCYGYFLNHHCHQFCIHSMSLLLVSFDRMRDRYPVKHSSLLLKIKGSEKLTRNFFVVLSFSVLCEVMTTELWINTEHQRGQSTVSIMWVHKICPSHRIPALYPMMYYLLTSWAWPNHDPQFSPFPALEL